MEPDLDTADPRRWWALGLVLLAMTIIVIDNTVLTVSIPRMMRDLHATLPQIQWVISGYALSYASLLVIGGRLGDMFGPRRLVILGAGLFGLGSLLASAATNVPQLVLGEAVIEGMGAALMTPSAMAILANTFRGRERTLAFAAYGTVIGAGSAFGPIVGGYLTTYHSWRWCFRINLIVAPIVILGALLVIRRDDGRRARQRLDLLGAFLVSVATFLLIFGFTQGDTYGWWHPTSTLSAGGRVLWPRSAPLSVIPLAFALGSVLLVAFVRTETGRERRHQHPLFALSQFRFLSFRYGVTSSYFMSASQVGGILVLPLFLQGAKHLSPVENGVWVLPVGVGVIAGAQFGGRLSARVGTTNVMRWGMVVSVIGLFAEIVVLRPGVEFWSMALVLLTRGIGTGFYTSQLARIVLHEIEPSATAAATAVNTTARQCGSASGVAVIGATFAVVARNHGVASAARPALLCSAVVLAAAMAMAWRIPHIDRIDRLDRPRRRPIDELRLLDSADA